MNLDPQQIIAAIRAKYGVVPSAALSLGCTEADILTAAASDPSIQAAIDDERMRVASVAEVKLRQAVLNGEAWAVKESINQKKEKRLDITTQSYNPHALDLTPEQESLVLELLAAGKAKGKPLKWQELRQITRGRHGFDVSYPQYKTRNQKLKIVKAKIRERRVAAAVKKGLEVSDARIELLNVLGRWHLELLGDYAEAYGDDVVGGDNGLVIPTERGDEYNQKAINSLLRIMDDLAKEVGDRKAEIKHSGSLTMEQATKMTPQEALEYAKANGLI